MGMARWSVLLVSFNPFTAVLAASSLGKRPVKMPNLKLLRQPPPPPPPHSHEQVKRLILKFTVLKVDVIWDHLFAGVYVSIFRPGNFTGWGSERVKDKLLLGKIR